MTDPILLARPKVHGGETAGVDLLIDQAGGATDQLGNLPDRVRTNLQHVRGIKNGGHGRSRIPGSHSGNRLRPSAGTAHTHRTADQCGMNSCGSRSCPITSQMQVEVPAGPSDSHTEQENSKENIGTHAYSPACTASRAGTGAAGENTRCSNSSVTWSFTLRSAFASTNN